MLPAPAVLSVVHGEFHVTERVHRQISSLAELACSVLIIEEVVAAVMDLADAGLAY
jgi:hypothetical protein